MPETKKKMSEQEGSMSLSGHLAELRNRSTVCIVVLLAVFCFCLYNAQSLISLFTGMGKNYGYQFVYISPQELLMQYFSVSLVIALVVSIPVISWEIWSFARPGLSRTENLAFAFSLVFGMIFFCIGVAFAYKVSVPFILYFLLHISDGSDISAAVSVQNYITFLMTIFLVFGTVFELPVVSVILTWLGILRSRWMRKGFRVVVVLIFVLAAVITPPDIVSQVMVALPMILLYQLGVFLSSICEKIKGKKIQEPEK